MYFVARNFSGGSRRPMHLKGVSSGKVIQVPVLRSCMRRVLEVSGSSAMEVSLVRHMLWPAL
jgi:hypothetical protein